LSSNDHSKLICIPCITNNPNSNSNNTNNNKNLLSGIIKCSKCHVEKNLTLYGARNRRVDSEKICFDCLETVNPVTHQVMTHFICMHCKENKSKHHFN